MGHNKDPLQPERALIFCESGSDNTFKNIGDLDGQVVEQATRQRIYPAVTAAQLFCLAFFVGL